MQKLFVWNNYCLKFHKNAKRKKSKKVNIKIKCVSK